MQYAFHPWDTGCSSIPKSIREWYPFLIRLVRVNDIMHSINPNPSRLFKPCTKQWEDVVRSREKGEGIGTPVLRELRDGEKPRGLPRKQKAGCLWGAFVCLIISLL